jgi:hypothetical protein
MPLVGQRRPAGIKLNGTHQLVMYADYMNLLRNNRYHKEKTGTLTLVKRLV